MKPQERFEKRKERYIFILKFIRQYVYQHGYSPSIREITSGCNLHSTSFTNMHLEDLRVLGFIKIGSNKNRAVVLIKRHWYYLPRKLMHKQPLPVKNWPVYSKKHSFL